MKTYDHGAARVERGLRRGRGVARQRPGACRQPAGAGLRQGHDKAGNAPPLTDPTNGLTFADLNSPPFDTQTFQTNLIMPEPTVFLSSSLPVCSIVRPTATTWAAMGALQFLTKTGLFVGQSPAFFAFMTTLAQAADAAGT